MEECQHCEPYARARLAIARAAYEYKRMLSQLQHTKNVLSTETVVPSLPLYVVSKLW